MQIASNCKKGNNVPKAFQLIAVVNYTHNFTCVTNYNQLLAVYMDLFLILKAPNSRLFLGNAFKPHNENCMFPFSAVVLKEPCLFRRSLEEIREEKSWLRSLWPCCASSWGFIAFSTGTHHLPINPTFPFFKNPIYI